MLAIIGGTGFYSIDNVEREQEADTPFGKPSAPLVFARIAETEVVFLPRHGPSHSLLPHEINYCANIYALKQAGARQLIAVSACGSLREEMEMGHFVLPDQYFDHTRGRRRLTFFGDGIAAHISTAEVSDPFLRKSLATAGKQAGATVHTGATFACVEGPRLGSRAESLFLRDMARADIVGMTCVPEAFLAREAQLCYATLAIVTDYDCWHSDPSRHVSVSQVIETYGQSLETARRIVASMITAGIPKADDKKRRALDSALLTRPEQLGAPQRAIMEVLQA